MPYRPVLAFAGFLVSRARRASMRWPRRDWAGSFLRHREAHQKKRWRRGGGRDPTLACAGVFLSCSAVARSIRLAAAAASSLHRRRYRRTRSLRLISPSMGALQAHRRKDGWGAPPVSSDSAIADLDRRRPPGLAHRCGQRRRPERQDQRNQAERHRHLKAMSLRRRLMNQAWPLNASLQHGPRGHSTRP